MSESKYLTSRNRDRLLNHVLALAEIRKQASVREQDLIRVAYKPRLTNRDLGKIYSALNDLIALCGEGEASAAKTTLKILKLKERN